MVSARTYGWWIGAWILVLGGYAAAILTIKPGYSLTAFGDLTQCVLPLLVNGCLLLNAGTSQWRRNIFWMLLALSCTLWMFGQFQWTYFEVYLRQPLPDPFPGDIIFFLRGIPLMAALALQPHWRRAEPQWRFGYLDFGLLLAWWVFLYVFVVLPWMYAAPSVEQYNYNYNLLTNIQNLLIAGGIGYLWLRTRGPWRKIYAHIFACTTLYMLSSLVINVAIDEHKYHTGSIYDLPLLTSFLWLGTAGLVAYRHRDELEAPVGEAATGTDRELHRRENVVISRLAIATVLSLPLFAIWALRFSEDPAPVVGFRLMVTLLASLPLAVLVFFRQHLGEADRARLLVNSEKSVEDLQRMQAHLVQSEKLASLGQLAAGAAHEINNPLTAILGFSDLLAEDTTLPEKTRLTAGKIREQARRTKTLVANLQSFARQVPSERVLLDINTIISNAVQLCALDLPASTRIDLQLEPVLPGVRGDGNQLLQIFFNILSNSLDAMEAAGGVLIIKSMRERGNVVVLFSDTGPGILEPNRVFDPFYTTKPVDKGTGLGLSICYGFVQEHSGTISCANRPEGGAVFRVELPAVLAVFPVRDPQTPVPLPLVPKKL
jgi:signal transduction histidine kinase